MCFCYGYFPPEVEVRHKEGCGKTGRFRRGVIDGRFHMEPKKEPEMGIKRHPVSFAVERWMRLPGLPTTVPTTPVTELFVFSGYADFTGGSEDSSDIDGPIEGNGFADSALQTQWLEYDVEEIVVGPHWRRIDGVCPTVVIGGHSQLSPDVADGMGFRVQGISNVDTVTVASGAKRIRLSVNVAVRGGLDGRILTLAYQVTAWGRTFGPFGNEGVFFAGSSDPT